MKTIQRTSSVLKVIGITLILLSLVLGLYALINRGAVRGALDQGLDRFGAGHSWTDEFSFDRHFFTALSRSTGNITQKTDARMEEITPDFTVWFDRIEKSVRSQEEEVRQHFSDWMNIQTPEALGISEMEEQQESRELREIFEYIDSLAAVPKKGKLASLKPASLEPVFQEYYKTFSQEHGEDAGTWFEFMSAVRRMMEQDGAKDAKAWLTDTFTFDNYQPVLEKVRSEEKTESAESISGVLNDLYERKAAGENVDFTAFLTQTADTLKARFPRDDLGGESSPTLIAIALPDMLKQGTAFDGSYGALADKVRTMAASEGEYTTLALNKEQDGTVTATPQNVSTLTAVRKWKKEFLQKTLDEADNRKDISIVGAFWSVVSMWVLILIAGIALILIARLIRWLLARHLLKKREDAGIREDPDILLRVEHLKQYFKSGPAVTKAVDDVSFFIKKGEVFGLVGESGCGKTTTGRTIINLYDPTEGNVYFDGLKISTTQKGLPVLKTQLRKDYTERINAARKAGNAEEAKAQKKELKEKLREAEDKALESSVEKSKCVEFYREKRLKELKEEYDLDMQSLSGEAAEERTRKYETEKKVAAKDNVMTRMQMIFQDPIASINPRMTVREIIAEGLIIRGVKDKEYIDRKVNEMLELVGLVPEHADRYPHEFSGGQRQRIGIARAIIMEPSLIIADEPISALDVSIQAQVINLLNELRERMGLTIMFIAHNLSVVKYFSDRIAVMYFGHIVELATSDELFAHPLHPYTKSLLSAIPYPDPHYEKTRKRIEYVPAKAHDYSAQQPTLREIEPGHWILCNDAEYEQYLKEIAQ